MFGTFGRRASYIEFNSARRCPSLRRSTRPIGLGKTRQNRDGVSQIDGIWSIGAPRKSAKGDWRISHRRTAERRVTCATVRDVGNEVGKLSYLTGQDTELWTLSISRKNSGPSALGMLSISGAYLDCVNCV
jgi:hypothetical protein